MSNNIKTQFGEQVRSIRLKHGLSQDQFAIRVGIDRTYISGIERGVRNPTLTMISRIAAGLSVRSAVLLKRL